jgi:hypothetical protein
MIKDYDGNKITPNQYAKELIVRMLDNLETWEEAAIGSRYNWDTGEMERTDGITRAEVAKINEMLLKRINGVEKYLGYHPRRTLNPFE